MKYILAFATILSLASCSSGHITKEEILAKHLKEEGTQLDSSREPAQAKQKSNHFKMAIGQKNFLNNYY